MKVNPILYIIIPCFNEEEVLPVTAPIFLEKIEALIEQGEVDNQSRILFVDDGSKDNSWAMIKSLSKKNIHYKGIAQSRNRGHQNAVLAGLMEAKDNADITISMDCDGQDDINVMDDMIKAYQSGAEIVYGVRSRRDTDSFFKRFTAESFYHLMNWMGAEIVFNHADYRLVSSKVLKEFSNFGEVNIFLRGMFPLVGFNSTCVYYERNERMKGKSHYPLKKMLALAFEGITSLSIKPIRMITSLGIVISVLGMAEIIWAVAMRILGNTIAGWSSIVCIICFLGGMQLLSLGIIGEYIGKIYLETKRRPRYIISERTEEEENRET